jgi:hypothetical protein
VRLRAGDERRYIASSRVARSKARDGWRGPVAGAIVATATVAVGIHPSEGTGMKLEIIYCGQ